MNSKEANKSAVQEMDEQNEVPGAQGLDPVLGWAPGEFNDFMDAAAADLSPEDITATYNLAVSVYNRGVALLKSMGVETSIGEMMAIQDRSATFFEQALPWFERANELQPNRPETLRGLMIVHYSLNDNAASEAFRAQLENALKP